MDPPTDLTAPDRLRELEEAFDKVIPEDLKTAHAPTVLDDPSEEGASGEAGLGLYRPLPETEGYAGFFEAARAGSTRSTGGLQAGFTTGLDPLDATIGGLAPGALTVLTGPPGSGKTTLAKQILDGVLEQNSGLLGFYFAPGERAADLRLRTLVRLARQNDQGAAATSAWRRGAGKRTDSGMLTRLLQGAPWIAREYLIGPEAGGFDARDLGKLIEREIRDKQAKSAVLVVDHLLSLCATHLTARSIEELSWHELMGLTLLAERIGGHVLVAYPYVRVPRRSHDGSEKREGPSETLSRLGPVAAEAPLVLSLTTGQAAGEGCLTVIKDRFGRTPRPITVAHDSEYARFIPTDRKAPIREERSHPRPAPNRSPATGGPTPTVTVDLGAPGSVPPAGLSPGGAGETGRSPATPRRALSPSPLTTEPERSPLRPRRSRHDETPKRTLPPR